MSIDLDRMAKQLIDSQPTQLPSIAELSSYAKRRTRHRRFVAGVSLASLVGIGAIAVPSVIDSSTKTELVATAERPDETRATSTLEDRPESATVPVPSLIDLSVSDAADLLTAAGLSYEVEVLASTGDRQRPGVVATSDPEAGTLIDTGATVTLAVTPSARCGDDLPVGVELATPTSGLEIDMYVDDQLDLVREIVLGSGELVVVRWPARDRTFYELDDGIPLFFPARLETGATGDSGEVSFTLTGLDKAEQPVGPSVELTVPADVASASSPPEGCEVIEVTVIGEAETAIFGWDLPNSGWLAEDGATGFPLRNLAPLVTSTEQVATAPSSVVGCTPNPADSDADSVDTFDSAVAALAAFLETEPAETFIKSGFHEMIAADGSHTFGILSDIPTRPPLSTDRFVTLITAADSGTGWAIVGSTASSC